ncbi:acyl carrier protein [Selenomonas sp. KH1T6]|uniref:acyl carrier protein n=1 Tax=Selenomonas sp. KH1T6 TaxID=3158784 RepID=UPI0008A7BBA9|nr:acyl carrier protein [Selenomonas ruminantium]
MNEQEKLALLEDMLELDEGTLKPETNLDDIEEYDSMSKLSLIVLMQDEFGVKLTSDEVKSFETIEDILKRMVEG